MPIYVAYMCVCICTIIYLCMYVCMYVCVCVSTRMYVHMHAFRFIWVYLRVCTYVSMFVCVYIYVYVCMYVSNCTFVNACESRVLFQQDHIQQKVTNLFLILEFNYGHVKKQDSIIKLFFSLPSSGTRAFHN